jgi:Na+/H+ antiporter NhaA
VFFLHVGMEDTRELVVGELRSVARAALPAIAAMGMVVPAGIYSLLNHGGPGQAGVFYGHGLDARWIAAAGVLTTAVAMMGRRLSAHAQAWGIAGALVLRATAPLAEDRRGAVPPAVPAP